MQKRLWLKLLSIAGLSVLLLIPLAMIESQITQRSARQAEVVRNIAESAAGPQTLVGPLIAVRYRERIEKRRKERDGGREVVEHEIVERTALFPPQRLELDGDLAVEALKRGLYTARLYRLAARLVGTATIPPQLARPSAQIVDARAYLVIGLADPRGIADDPEVSVNGQGYRFLPGTEGGVPGAGLHVALGDLDLAHGGRFDFTLPLNLTGLEHFALAPTALATRVTLKSTWPHPSFQGRFLPLNRSVSGEGFSATWQVSHLARNFDHAQGELKEPRGEVLRVSLIDPVNVYLKSERAVKYGVLFVVLTFGAFFLTELLRSLAIHPLQYLLVGLALAMFFLLLIALSEHIDFAWAYLLSALACVALIGVYLTGALGNRRRGFAFAAALTMLYGVLYGVLASEDNALLMGTLLLFIALGGAMLATRRLDWYRFAAAG